MKAGNSNTLVVVGCQWGDEGKGKVVDFLARDFDIVVRYNGGNNAGHTVVIGDEKYKFHLLPSGSIQGKRIVIGNGMAVDPKVLIGEIETLKAKGIDPKLYVSDRAHVIMPYHRLLDLSGEKKSESKLGTTQRGIGPTYAGKVNRIQALRMADLVNGEMREKIRSIVRSKAAELVESGIIKSKQGAEDYAGEMIKEYSEYADKLRPYITDTVYMLNGEIGKGSKVLFEGAQGTMLDVDHGTYPYVTSSNSVAGGVCTGAGIGPGRIGKILGVAKAYTTRVGEGPFPSEINDKKGDMIREKGKEYGTTTGRPRRCGWLDLVVLRHAGMINGLDGIVLSKLDVLSGIGKIKVCTSYRIDGKVVRNFPAYIKEVEKAEPVYEELDGWPEFKGTRKEDLPENARKYMDFIERETGVPVTMISVGESREQMIVINQ